MLSSETCQEWSLSSGILVLQSGSVDLLDVSLSDLQTDINVNLSYSKTLDSMNITHSSELVTSPTELTQASVSQSSCSSSFLADILLACGLPAVSSAGYPISFAASIQSEFTVDNNDNISSPVGFQPEFSTLDTSALHVLADTSLLDKPFCPTYNTDQSTLSSAFPSLRSHELPEADLLSAAISSTNLFDASDPTAQNFVFLDYSDQGNRNGQQDSFNDVIDHAQILYDLRNHVHVGSRGSNTKMHVSPTSSGYATDSEVDADDMSNRKRRRARVPTKHRTKDSRTYCTLRTGRGVKRKLASDHTEERQNRQVKKHHRPTRTTELSKQSTQISKPANTDENLELTISLAGSWSGSEFSSSSSESSSGSDNSDDDSACRLISDDDFGSSSSDDEEFFSMINTCPYTCPCRSSDNMTPLPPAIKRRKRFRTIEPLKEKLLRRRLLSHSNMWNNSCCELKCSKTWKKYRPTAVGMTKDYKNDNLHVLRFSWGDWQPEDDDDDDDENDDDYYF